MQDNSTKKVKHYGVGLPFLRNEVRVLPGSRIFCLCTKCWKIGCDDKNGHHLHNLAGESTVGRGSTG